MNVLFNFLLQVELGETELEDKNTSAVEDRVSELKIFQLSAAEHPTSKGLSTRCRSNGSCLFKMHEQGTS